MTSTPDDIAAKAVAARLSASERVVLGFFTQPLVGNDDIPALRHPAVHVLFGPAGGPARQVIGVLDTGADLCRIDTELGANCADDGFQAGWSVGIATSRPRKRGIISLVGSDFTLSGGFATADLRSSGMMYDILLGMDFIQHFQLSVGRKGGEVRLTW